MFAADVQVCGGGGQGIAGIAGAAGDASNTQVVEEGEAEVGRRGTKQARTAPGYFSFISCNFGCTKPTVITREKGAIPTLERNGMILT